MIRKFITNFLRFLVLLYDKLQKRYKFIKNDIILPKEPVLFLCNHQMNFDAVRLRAHTNRRIAFIAHDELFKNKLFKWLAVNILDLICRGSSKNDISFIKELFRAKKNNLDIGIYPEGGINYFNHSSVIDINLAKLCKKLEMPIIIVNVNGGSFVIPRYAKYKGHNIVEYSYKKIIPTNIVRDLSVDELFNLLKAELYVNDYDWQKQKMSPVRRKSPTINLKRSLFVCPNCNDLHTLKFGRKQIKCITCNSCYSLDKYDFVIGAKKINTLVDWDIFQYNTLSSKLKTQSIFNPLEDKITMNICPLRSYFKNKNKKIANIKLYNYFLEIKSKSDYYKFNIQDLKNIYVEHINTLQFSIDDLKIRIYGKKFPAYIWVTYLRCLQNSQEHYIYITNIPTKKVE